MSTPIQMKYSEKTGGFTASSHVERLMFRRSRCANQCSHHCGCIETHKGNVAAILQRIASALCGNSSNPLLPEPPSICSCFSYLTGARGGPGGKLCLCFPPGGFAPLSTCESGYRETQSNLQGSLKLLFTSSSSPSPSAPCRP